jgi:hypothetical protein
VVETDWNVNFWKLNEADQRRVLEAFAHSGAQVAVSDEAPPDRAYAPGWKEAGNTNYYAYQLSQLSTLRQPDSSFTGVDLARIKVTAP